MNSSAIKIFLITALLLAFVLFAWTRIQRHKHLASAKVRTPVDDRVVKTPAEWKAQLTEEQFYVTREKGTERPFTGKYWDNKEDGQYNCIGCDLPLFDSSTKYSPARVGQAFLLPSPIQTLPRNPILAF